MSWFFKVITKKMWFFKQGESLVDDTIAEPHFVGLNVNSATETFEELTNAMPGQCYFNNIQLMPDVLVVEIVTASAFNI